MPFGGSAQGLTVATADCVVESIGEGSCGATRRGWMFPEPFLVALGQQTAGRLVHKGDRKTSRRAVQGRGSAAM